jgi:hypothetical protein
VFRPSYAQPLSLVEPVDTGNWEDACNSSHPLPPPAQRKCTYPYPLNCSQWDRTQGTFAHMDHIILANARLLDGGLANCTGGRLGRVFRRLYGELDSFGHPPPVDTAKELISFMEPDIAGAVRFADGGVKLLVADFPSLFGTEDGERLRRVCRKWRWPLLWGLGPNGAHGPAALSGRALDPAVCSATASRRGPAAGAATAGRARSPRGPGPLLNASVPAADAAAFGALWALASRTRAGKAPPSAAAWAGWWDSLPASVRVSAGAKAGQCSDMDRCVGVDPAGTCVC